MKQLKLGIPKGSLEQATISLFKQAGWQIHPNSRNYFPGIDDPELSCSLVRSQEMANYVANGTLDLGLTGLDWILESGSEVVEICDLVSSKSSDQPCRWVLVVPQDSPIESVEDLEGCRIATELVNFTRRYLSERGIQCVVEFSWGATEVKPPRLADAIVEVTETGSSLRANNLRIVDTILSSTPRLIANEKSWQDKWKCNKIKNITLMLHAAMAAEGKVGLMMNVPKELLNTILKILPALRKPTVSSLATDDWAAINTIIDESVVRDLIPRLKAAGASGIVEYPLSKIIE